MARAVWWVLGFFAAASFACSPDGDDGPGADPAEGGSTGEGGSIRGGAGGSGRGGHAGGAQGGTSATAGLGNTSGVSDGGSSVDGGAAGSGGAGGEDTAAVPLPAGSREVNGIVNLVDAAAATELEAYLTTTGIVNYWEGHLATNLNLFLEHYTEEYDFVYFFTDHPVESAGAIGRFEEVTRPALRGTGLEDDVEREGYTTNGRTKGVIGVQYRPERYGPLAHEMVHYWANYLDVSFGFGLALNDDFGLHWGHAGVDGVLGGFDPETLTCASPAGMAPPGCERETNGRTRYAVELFHPNDNGVARPYGPLELYLMGLLPVSDVPEQIAMLREAESLYDTYDEQTGRFLVEAAELEWLDVADIVDRHGEVELLPARERAFSAAFVVVSAKPAADAVLEEVAKYAAYHGNRATTPTILSFEALTGGRATLETRLGPRRKIDDPVPPVRVPSSCDLFGEDCGEGKGCHFYGQPPSVCGIAGDGAQGETCRSSSDCAPGLDCVARRTQGTGLTCERYCDPDPSKDNACGKICSGWASLTDRSGAEIVGICRGP